MKTADLVELCPRLYHATAIDNWDLILEHGLLPVSVLLQRFEHYDGQHNGVNATIATTMRYSNIPFVGGRSFGTRNLSRSRCSAGACLMT